jgi:hypothetical protein
MPRKPTSKPKKLKRKSRIKTKPRALPAVANRDDDVLRSSADAYSAQAGWFAFLSKSALASALLPLRLSRCRTPFEFFGEQLKFVQDRVSDAQSAVQSGLGKK